MLKNCIACTFQALETNWQVFANNQNPNLLDLEEYRVSIMLVLINQNRIHYICHFE